MPALGALSFGLAGGAFGFLAVLLVAAWGGRDQGARLIAAAIATAIWGAALAWQSAPGGLPATVIAAVELLRYATWFAVLAGLLPSVRGSRAAKIGVLGAWAGLLIFVAVDFVLLRGSYESRDVVTALAPGAVLALLSGLVALGYIYAKADRGTRHAVGALVGALAVVFAFDTLAYAAVLLRSAAASVVWDLRGSVAAATVPLIAVAAKRNPHWTVNIFVSRYVAFYGTALLAVVAILGVVVVSGRFIRQFGGDLGWAMQLAFLAVSAVSFAALAASADLRRRLRVFVSKHFYRSRYDYRAEWLRFIQTLSGPGHDRDPGGHAIRAIAQIINSPGGVLFLHQPATASFEPTYAWPEDRLSERRFAPVPVDSDLVGFLEQRQWVIDLEELHETPAAYDSITMPPEFAASRTHRIVLPLLHGATLIGFIVLDDPPAPFRPNFEDRDLLKTVGRHVATHIAQHEADRRLAESRQFEAYHRLTAYVMHDLKNLAAQLTLIVDNAKRHKRNPEFVDDTIATVANSTQRMQRLIEQLQGREPRDQRREIAIADIVRRACKRCALSRPAPTLGDCDTQAMVEADPERLTTALEHVIRNAQDATPDDGTVTVSVRVDNGSCLVTVSDTGCGMTDDFIRERLFKPFDTTKGSQGMGVGAYQLREYVQSLAGSVEVTSAPGCGTNFVVRLNISSS